MGSEWQNPTSESLPGFILTADRLGLDLLSRLELAQVAHDHAVAFGESREDLNPVLAFSAQFHRSLFQDSGGVHQHHLATISGPADCLDRQGEDILRTI